eukprot:3469283-Amphidinium_carterae.1
MLSTCQLHSRRSRVPVSKCHQHTLTTLDLGPHGTETTLSLRLEAFCCALCMRLFVHAAVSIRRLLSAL